MTDTILDLFFPRHCEDCQQKMTGRIGSRPYIVRCNLCGKQKSRLSCTPLHHLKLPQWMFGFAVEESFIRHPAVITSRELQRRLGITYNSARLLKLRVQLFASQQKPAIIKLMRQELLLRFPENQYKLPGPEYEMLREKAAEKPVPQADTVVLFSASQRANKGRKRHKHGGATASIYMSEKLGGKQIGTLTQVFSWKKGPLLIDCIPDQKIDRLKPLLDGYLTPNSPLFTDEGYRWLSGLYMNHRMVNHSAHAKDKRYKWARNRWCKNGVHCQVAEGNGGSMKRAFTAYGYVRPEFAPLYLNEWSFWKNVKYFGLENIARENLAQGNKGEREREPQDESKAQIEIGLRERERKTELEEIHQNERRPGKKERSGEGQNSRKARQGESEQARSTEAEPIGEYGQIGESDRTVQPIAQSLSSTAEGIGFVQGPHRRQLRPRLQGVGTRVDSDQTMFIWRAH